MREMKKGLKRILAFMLAMLLMLNGNVAGMVAESEENVQVVDAEGKGYKKIYYL